MQIHEIEGGRVVSADANEIVVQVGGKVYEVGIWDRVIRDVGKSHEVREFTIERITKVEV